MCLKFCEDVKPRSEQNRRAFSQRCQTFFTTRRIHQIVLKNGVLKTHHIDTYIHIYIYTYIHVCTYVCLYVCMSVCLSVCRSVCMYACMHVCIFFYYIYMYTYPIIFPSHHHFCCLNPEPCLSNQALEHDVPGHLQKEKKEPVEHWKMLSCGTRKGTHNGHIVGI